MELNFFYGPGIVPIDVCHVVERLYPSVKFILDVLEEFGFWVGVSVRVNFRKIMTEVNSLNVFVRNISISVQEGISA